MMVSTAIEVLPVLRVADDQLALAAAEGEQGVDGQDAGLDPVR